MKFLMTLFLTMIFMNTGYAQIKDITWELGPNLPEFRKGGCFGVIGEKLVSVFGMRFPWGEMASMYVYDPEENLWTRGPDGPLGQCYVEGIECNGQFYSIGGRKGTCHNRCFCLSEKNGNYIWHELPHLKNPRGWAPSVAINSRLYVFGGSAGNNGPTLNSVEVLDTNHLEKGWEQISQIPGDSRGWCGAAAVQGKIYLIGGAHLLEPVPVNGSKYKRFKDVMMFDPVSTQWQQKAPLPYALSGLDCCVYLDRYIIVVGGASDTTDYTPEMSSLFKKDRYYKNYYTPFVLVYDTKLDSWTRLPGKLPMPTNDIRIAIMGKKLYVLGGENIEPATSNTTPWLRIGQIIQ